MLQTIYKLGLLDTSRLLNIGDYSRFPFSVVAKQGRF